MCVFKLASRGKTERLSEVEAAIEKAFSAIAEAQPEGVRSSSCKAGDGTTFVAPALEKKEEPRKTVLA
jgi:hypothetical protein